SHVVFTLPHELAPLALQNKQIVYGLLFRSSAETLLEIAKDPRHLGAEIGFFSVLHTWNQKLQHHPHVHCVVASGGLSPDHTRWLSPRHPKFFLPESVLSEVFRGKFTDPLEQSFTAGELRLHGQLKPFAQPRLFRSFLRQLFRHRWWFTASRRSDQIGGPRDRVRFGRGIDRNQVLHVTGAVISVN